MIRKLPIFAVALLTGCVSFPTGGNPLLTEITKINAAGISDLQRVEAIASVPNSAMAGGIEDAPGLQCAQGAVTVLNQINAINAAANVAGGGVLSAAEIASIFQPGSPQYKSAENTLATACIAKANAVLGAAGVLAAGGVVGALVSSPQILPLVAAAP